MGNFLSNFVQPNFNYLNLNSSVIFCFCVIVMLTNYLLVFARKYKNKFYEISKSDSIIKNVYMWTYIVGSFIMVIILMIYLDYHQAV